MTTWSFYNRLFSLEGIGYFLYNALSGRLLQLDEAHYRLSEIIRAQGKHLGDKDMKFTEMLVNYGFLMDKENEKLLLTYKREQRDRLCADQSRLILSICPTLACNFKCSYCFESFKRDNKVMSRKTIDQLINFIRQHKKCRELFVTWYGGEPTMAFDVIETLTERFLEIFPQYNHATLITNAYLLYREKVEKLNKLKISCVQVTLDGPEPIHDRRRTLTNGTPTYNKILENLDILLNSSYSGTCVIRVNVNRHNQDIFPSFCSELLNRYPNKPLSVYAARLTAPERYSSAHSDNIECNEWATFIAREDCRYGFIPGKEGFPDSNQLKICTAFLDTGYVVAPDGALYKCLKDVGIKDMIIGSVYSNDLKCQGSITQLYQTTGDPFLDSKCTECPAFPICDEGCANQRISVKGNTNSTTDCSSPYKEALEMYLETYIKFFLKGDLCNIILGKASSTIMSKGYRLIDPESIAHDNNRK